MKFLSFIFILLFVLQAAQVARAQETLLQIDKDKKVWITPPGESIKLAGKVVTLKKGTLLYHWSHATPDQAKAWNDAGKISPELLTRLKQGYGSAGGGFYASMDPLDSISYGNTLVVIELQTDIHIVNSDRIMIWRNAYWPAMEKAHLSAAVVPHTTNWMNIIDAQALAKEFVADASFFSKQPIEKIPAYQEIKALLGRFPSLNSDSHYQELLKLAEKIQSDIDSKDKRRTSKGLLRTFEKGSTSAKTSALASLINSSFVPNLNEKLVNHLITAIMADSSQLSSAAIDFLKIATAERRPLNEYIFFKATKNPILMDYLIQNMSRQLDSKNFSALLQEAEINFGKDTLTATKYAIDSLKKQGKWDPPLLCTHIFR